MKPSYQKKKKTTAKLSVEKLDRIAKPVRKYAGRDDRRFAKESDKVECTFKPSKSKVRRSRG